MHRAKRGSSTVLARPYHLQAVLPAACISSLLAFLNFPFQIVLRIIAFSYTALSKSLQGQPEMALEQITGKDWYQILGAQPSDSPAELKRKYQRLALLVSMLLLAVLS